MSNTASMVVMHQRIEKISCTKPHEYDINSLFKVLEQRQIVAQKLARINDDSLPIKELEHHLEYLDNTIKTIFNL